MLLDIENEQRLERMITKPKREDMLGKKVTKPSMDVLLSDEPELFKCSGYYYPSLSDHALIYGVLKERLNPNKPIVTTLRNYKDNYLDVLSNTFV